MRAQGIEVRYVRSTLLDEEETVFCVFDAPNRHAVETVSEHTDIPYDRIVSAFEVHPHHRARRT
jgi:hypothetical protein